MTSTLSERKASDAESCSSSTLSHSASHGGSSARSISLPRASAKLQVALEQLRVQPSTFRIEREPESARGGRFGGVRASLRRATLLNRQPCAARLWRPRLERRPVEELSEPESSISGGRKGAGLPRAERPSQAESLLFRPLFARSSCRTRSRAALSHSRLSSRPREQAKRRGVFRPLSAKDVTDCRWGRLPELAPPPSCRQR